MVCPCGCGVSGCLNVIRTQKNLSRGFRLLFKSALAARFGYLFQSRLVVRHAAMLFAVIRYRENDWLNWVNLLLSR